MASMAKAERDALLSDDGPEVLGTMRRDRRADGVVAWGAVVVSTALWIALFAMLCWALTP